MNLLLEKEPSSVIDFNKIDWSQEYNLSSDKNAFIDNFINAFLRANNINSGIGFKDALHNQLELFGGEGMNEGLNPFLTWIVKYDKVVGGLNTITDDAYNNLNTLYGNGIIFDKDLMGTSNLGTKTILFNADFYTKSSKDFVKLAQTFYLLDGSYGKSKFMEKIKALKGPQKYEFTQRLKANFSSFFTDKLYKDENVIKYFIVFKDGKYSPSGELRDVRDISSAIAYLDTQVEDKEEKSKDRVVKKEETPKNDRLNQLDPIFKSNLEDAKKAALEMGKEEKLIDSLINVIIKAGGYERATADNILEAIISMDKIIKRGK
jgi:hypothetical protein